ncbi:ABC transporter ATP-binding protein [Aidingimonas halophila]|uniref:Putative ABC transport system ATP-binding protein n=1 Tax=Aidingimonas halophila TaxID=574349 RepID=A0A1H3FJV4_9GAMM|nr:ABC transporter ATP-binding protein [Aidingimonas halophila]GHC37720.1 ABC transporter ATP-binding protein [Aidingimonas halophila]SDX91115.1 putative ABC transport system ATP-binding protein [Aidingimonas halophila]
MLELRDVSKSYATPQGPLSVLRGVSLQLAAGESLALMGESGCGKSTLLHLAAGLDTPDSGRIWLADRALDAMNEAQRSALRRHRLGLVFQAFHLVPTLTVSDNLRLQARLAKQEVPDWSVELLERLGLAKYRDHYPEQLSGGQQQRLAIGRALAVRPNLLLADEPTGNLDERNADDVLALLMELVVETGSALLLVTHSPRVADPMNRCLRLHHGRLETIEP